MVNNFNGKPAVECERRAMFAELAIVSMLSKVGWSARWVSVNYRMDGKPHYMTEWNDTKPFKQTSVPLSDECLTLMISIENICSNRHDRSIKGRKPYGGAWDIMAWQGERILFMESKRKGNDTVKRNQVDWYLAAIESGLERDNFLVVQWQFENEKSSGRRSKSLMKSGAPVTSVP